MNDIQTQPSGGGDDARPTGEWSVSETLSDRHLMVTGTTGFLGKVYASMLLRHHPDIGGLHLLIRPSGDTDAETRFEESLVRSPAFDPLREIYGMGLDEFLDETVEIVEGDITEQSLGLEDERARRLSDQLDLIVNCAGLTNFNPNLEHALSINTLSQRRILDFCRLADDPAKYLHVSTAFVAGNRSGRIPEKLPDETDYPRHDDLEVPFDYEREIEDCVALIDHAERLADDQEHQSRFAAEAREKLERNNRPPDDDAYFEQAFRDARRSWLRDYLSEEGMERAAHWGWPNIYTYTKSLGERILADTDDVDVAICRPAIIESSVSYPEEGWVEGVNTSGPLSFLMYKGHRFIPTRERMNLDIIPVDFVAGSLMAVGAGLLRGRASDVYHLGSSDRNPVSTHRMVELTTLGSRQVVGSDGETPAWQKALKNMLDSIPVDPETFRTRSAPRIKNWTDSVSSWLDDVPTERLGALGSAIDGLKSGVNAANQAAASTEYIVDIFFPFIAENDYQFLSRNIDPLVAGLPVPEQRRYGPRIDDLNWRDYWVYTHIPALDEHIFPRIERRMRSRGNEPLTYESLVELFDASTANYGDRVAFQHQADGEIVEQYTYADVEAAANRAATVMTARGVASGHKVLLASENRPQWGMAYFGILQAGGVPVPVDPDSSVDELVSFVQSSDAQLIVLSDKVERRLGDQLREVLDKDVLAGGVVTFDELLREGLPAGDVDADDTAQPTDIAKDSETLPARRPDGDSLASLIFTSGTTGSPKGVRLTHHNFTELLKNLNSVFDIDDRDRFVSLLPLHHTFEFSSGFLMPLSQGATITYLEERNGEELITALQKTGATAVVGVPALWELVERRIREQIDEAPPAARRVLEAAMDLNRQLRESGTGNLGRLLFAPFHRALGGSLRYLVSGGAPLPDRVQETFRGLGFDLLEGYGLTEAAPVLTVDRPDEQAGTAHVGRPLPDVDVKIDDPGEDGVGEILARGPNVMEGYLDAERTEQTFTEDGWLRTGDLGRIDEAGRLEIVGREKEVILTPGGKNVYPDELEDVYADHPAIEELSIVGLEREGGGERVAALVYPDTSDADISEQEIRADIRDHFSVQASRLASHKKIRTLRFWDQPLPKTATRKIQRSEVRQILRRMLDTERREAEQRSDGIPAWLAELLADLAGVDSEDVTAGTHLYEDLGFDSLMLTEAAGHLRRHADHIDRDDLANAERVADLVALVDADQTADGKEAADDSDGQLVPVDQKRYRQIDAVDVPEPVAEAGKQVLSAAQWSTYDTWFDVDVYGEAHIPWNDPNVLVVANHSSHLDMGLVKYALGSFGEDIRALAAADYFFEDPLRKTYFGQFTNLIPLDRSGSLEEALEEASNAILHGETLLIFPEGTRSTDGTIQPFQSGLGYLVETHDIDVLPLYLDGTYEALPKGRALPSPFRRNLSVHIGDVLRAGDLVDEVGELNGKERFAGISDVTREAVLDLRDAAEGYDRHSADVTPLFEQLRDRYRAEHAEEATSFYFSLGDLDEFKWTVLIDPPDVDVRRGKPDGGHADCVIKTSPEMFRRIVEEQYTPSMDEFVSGDIKTNDPELLRDFQRIFDLQ